MKVVIFCGGQGLRMREASEVAPKPMIPVGSRPVLLHVMKYYAHFGFTDFVLCLGYKAEAIKHFFLTYNEAWPTTSSVETAARGSPVETDSTLEHHLRGTGGAAAWVSGFAPFATAGRESVSLANYGTPSRMPSAGMIATPRPPEARRASWPYARITSTGPGPEDGLLRTSAT